MAINVKSFQIYGVRFRLNDWIARGFGISIFFITWTTIASIFPEQLMPYPTEAIILMWGLVQDGTIWPNLAATMSAIFWGFLGSMLLGIQMGVSMGINNFQRKFMTPQVIFALTTPHISWGIVATLIFGFDILAPIVATILVTFPFVALNVWKGVENIDGDLIQMAKAFDISFPRLLRHVIIPNTAAELFTATRLGIAMSWKTVAITEMFAASQGLGYKVIQSYESIYFEKAWAWALVFMIVILLIEYGIIKPMERKVFEYRSGSDFSMIG